jgi:hypothetical protein
MNIKATIEISDKTKTKIERRLLKEIRNGFYGFLQVHNGKASAYISNHYHYDFGVYIDLEKAYECQWGITDEKELRWEKKKLIALKRLVRKVEKEIIEYETKQVSQQG